MDFREYDIVADGEEVVIVGTIRDPVNWDFTIRFCEDDVPGVTRLVLRKKMLGLLLRSFFRRKKHHHWGQERAEHLAEGKRRLVAAREKAEERAKASKEEAAPKRAGSARAVSRTATGGTGG
jgi:hypothetical protein